MGMVQEYDMWVTVKHDLITATDGTVIHNETTIENMTEQHHMALDHLSDTAATITSHGTWEIIVDKPENFVAELVMDNSTIRNEWIILDRKVSVNVSF